MRAIRIEPKEGHTGRVVIELAGTAGAGKSFLMEKLRDTTEAQVYRRKGRLTDYLFLLFILPSLAFVTKDWTRVSQNTARRVLLFRSLSRETEGVYVVDEGPWHVFSAYYGTRTWRLVEWLLLYACMPMLKFTLPDHVIFLSVSPEKVQSRRRARARRNEKTLDHEEIVRASHVKARLLQFLSRRFSGNVKLRTFENETDDSWKTILRYTVSVAWPQRPVPAYTVSVAGRQRPVPATS